MRLAADVKKYLNEPDKRFRRVRDKFGNLQLSENAKAYHPGRGVYRSSARNAQRLARTEINMAYRTAEQERWKQFDFVVGYEIKTTQNGKHEEDICDCLSGKYPKTFKFVGWHPHCLCYCIPLLKTEDEFWNLNDRAKSVNEVTDVPQGFKHWVADNRDRIEQAEERGKLPYFIRDNNRVVENILEGGSGNGKTQASNDKTETKDRVNHGVPPHVEEYKSYSDGKIMVSPLHGKDELNPNLKLAETLYEAMGETVYLLPNINPNGADAHLRTHYIPRGVKDGKNADFMCANRIWDGKEASFEKSDKSRKSIKSIIENHIKKAKQQADNMIIEIPDWVKEEWVEQVVTNYLRLTSANRWIIIKRENGEWRLYKSSRSGNESFLTYFRFLSSHTTVRAVRHTAV